MPDRINSALERLFQKQRIIFWYDDDAELKKRFDAVSLDGVEKLEIRNNEFGLKYRMLRECPTQKFLVYKSGPQPPDKANWLLDVQLAHAEFSTDKAALWLTELELPYEFKSVVQRHEDFFENAKRRDRLKSLVKDNDTVSQIRLKMLSVCAEADARLDSVVENLLEELARGDIHKRLDLIVKCNLDAFFWEQMDRAYGYQSDLPTIKDFAIELFKSCYNREVGGSVKLGSESVVFLSRWRDSLKHHASFEKLSHSCAEILGIQTDLDQRDYKSVAELDYFELIDKKIISELISAIMDRTITAGECKQLVRLRRRGHWFNAHQDIYEAIEHASQFIHLLDSVNLNVDSLSHGIAAYTQSLYQVDQAYRKFIYHAQRANQPTLFHALREHVCKHYSNSFLLPLGDRWQELVDTLDEWKLPDTRSQRGFFHSFVWRVLNKNHKVFVIISDAMRYEIGEELCRLIRQEDRFEADLDHMATCLPCYTQLGMASLLPHKTLQINANKSGTVNVDGKSSSGTENRDSILKGAADGAALAVLASDLMSKTKEECRGLVRDHNVIYIYQDKIDFKGHKQKTEKEVFVAAEEAIDELVKLIRKLTSANANNVVITADHGFLYQDEVEESDYSSAEVTGDEVLATDRRFVIGHNLKVKGPAKTFTSVELGLDGDLEVALPKSINRFRKSGSSTRFVHGGMTLQEILVPIVQVKKRRERDVTVVGVEMLPGTTSVISTGQLSVAFYQTEPITDKVQARTLRIGLYSGTGELISDCHELVFDLDSDNPREREQKIKLVLSKNADAYNKQQVFLKLEEPVANTSHFTEFKSVPYTLRRSFTSDFD